MYPDIFENGDFFLRFPKAKKINASTRGVFESFLPVHTKLLKRWKYDSMPYWACVMLWYNDVVKWCFFDVRHHCIRKPPFSSAQTFIHWHCFQVSYARAHLAKRNKFASKGTLYYFRKKYPEYADNWLVSQIAVRAETVNVTAHRVRCNT